MSSKRRAPLITTSGGGDETVDPETTSHLDELAAEVAFLEIAFHSDLRRVGDRALLGSRSTARTVVVGRDEPLFTQADDRQAAPLADPCVSRRQLEIRWIPDEQLFHLERVANARREISLWTVVDDGVREVPWPASGRAMPGSFLSIGDRVLFRLDCGPLPSADSLGLIGGGRAFQHLRLTISALASTASSVLILGETGTGKELVARAFHAASARRKLAFLPLNCAAVPDALVEAELFGFEKGAFSGAEASREGLFRAAGRGTVFLDEVGELSPASQAKLLRALQERRVRPIGSPNEVPFEAAIVMATHRDLAAEVHHGTFRSDLYARIEAPAITLSPLRRQREDVPRLFAYFLSLHLEGQSLRASPFRSPDTSAPLIPMDAFLRMLRHDWPRNVREVDKLASRIAIDLRTLGRVDHSVFAALEEKSPARRVEAQTSGLSRRLRDDLPPTTDELLALLDQHDYVQSRLAKTLGISRTTLDKWMRDLGVRRPSDVARDELLDTLRRHQGDVEKSARSLRISTRGLRLRARELAIMDEDDGH